MLTVILDELVTSVSGEMRCSTPGTLTFLGVVGGWGGAPEGLLP